MSTWYRTPEDLPTTRLVLLYFCILLALQGPIGHLTLNYSLSGGLLLNQIGLMLILPGILCGSLRFDVGTLFPFGATLRRNWYWILPASFCVIFLSDFALRATEYALPIPAGIQETLDQLLTVHSIGDFLKKLFLFCLLPAVAEEIYFRGFCQTTFEHRLGMTPAILFSALLFALAHGNIWYLHLYFGLGCFLGWIYAESGSLWTAITAHFLNNTWTFITHMLGWDITSVPPVAQVLLVFASASGLYWAIRHPKTHPPLTG
jgi:membrane protease YdiL (CAAX protease family)